MSVPFSPDPLLERLYGLSEDDLLTDRSGWKFLSRQPCQAPTKPSTDTIVTWFLEDHGVNITPPKKPRKPTIATKSRISSAMMGGAMGALGGPLAVGIQSHLSQQEEAAIKAERLSLYAAEMAEYSTAHQEWTSWKKWALSHDHWDEFFDECIAAWEDECIQADLFNKDFEDWIRSEDGLLERRELIGRVEEHRALTLNLQRRKAKKQRVLSILFFVAPLSALLAYVYTGFGILALVGPVIVLAVIALLLAIPHAQ